MKLLAALLLVALQGAPAQTETFDIPLAPTSWIAAAIVPAYEGDETVTGVLVELDGVVVRVLAHENRRIGVIGTGTFQNLFMHWTVARDPLLLVPILTGTTGGGSAQLTNGPFDGTVDYDGRSGEIAETPPSLVDVGTVTLPAPGRSSCARSAPRASAETRR
jgi:hypothetical protein